MYKEIKKLEKKIESLLKKTEVEEYQRLDVLNFDFEVHIGFAINELLTILEKRYSQLGKEAVKSGINDKEGTRYKYLVELYQDFKSYKDLLKISEVKEYQNVRTELRCRKWVCLGNEGESEEWLDEKYESSEKHRQYMISLEKKGELKKKFHPAMANEQEKLDRETENPIDMSNAPDDADHIEDYKD